MTKEIILYIESIPQERKDAFLRLRETINQNLPAGFQEIIQYRMPSWVVPHSIYPAGYHCDKTQPLPFIGLANQKQYIAFYHMGMYADPTLMEWFTSEYASQTGQKPDMGKSCIRFKKMEKIPFALMGELCGKMTPHDWITLYKSAFNK